MTQREGKVNRKKEKKWKSFRAARWRQGAAAESARQCPYGGRAAAGTGKPWLVDKAFYAAHNKRGRQGAAAECARQCPSGGRAAAGTRKASVGLYHHLYST